MIDFEYLTESKQDQEKFKSWILNGYIENDGLNRADAKEQSDYDYDIFMNGKQSIRPPMNDIYYWIKNNDFNSFKQLIDKIFNDNNVKREYSQKIKDGAKLIYSDKNWKVYQITNYEASAKYGKNTKWCISGSKAWSDNGNGKLYFDSYVKSGAKFYFFINSNNRKYALTVIKDGSFEINDDRDNNLTYIPNAPKIDEIGVNYCGNSIYNKLCNLVTTDALQISILSDCISHFHTEKATNIEDYRLYDNVKEFCDDLSDMIPEGMLEDGNSDNTDEHEWYGGDFIDINTNDGVDVGSIETKERATDTNTYKDYKYFEIYEDVYWNQFYINTYKTLLSLFVNLGVYGSKKEFNKIAINDIVIPKIKNGTIDDKLLLDNDFTEEEIKEIKTTNISYKSETNESYNNLTKDFDYYD